MYEKKKKLLKLFTLRVCNEANGTNCFPVAFKDFNAFVVMGEGLREDDC